MKYLIFSDTHLPKKFDKKRFEFLSSLINDAENIIINGDFWEGLQISFDEFITSEWNKLFPLLKKKNTTYIFGNHDPETFSDNRIYQFCNKAVKHLDLDFKEYQYKITHGQKYLFPRYDKDVPLEKARKKKNVFQNKFDGVIQSSIIKLFGNRLFPQYFNKLDPKARDELNANGKYLVFGHSHTPKFDHKNRFINLGFINWGYATYLVLDEKGKPKYVNTKY